MTKSWASEGNLLNHDARSRPIVCNSYATQSQLAFEKVGHCLNPTCIPFGDGRTGKIRFYVLFGVDHQS